MINKLVTLKLIFGYSKASETYKGRRGYLWPPVDPVQQRGGWLVLPPRHVDIPTQVMKSIGDLEAMLITLLKAWRESGEEWITH